MPIARLTIEMAMQARMRRRSPRVSFSRFMRRKLPWDAVVSVDGIHGLAHGLSILRSLVIRQRQGRRRGVPAHIEEGLRVVHGIGDVETPAVRREDAVDRTVA